MGGVLPKNRDEFARVLREHAPRIRAVLHHRGIRGAELADLTQTVLLVAVESAEKLPKDPAKLAAWFAEVARRRALEWHKAPWSRHIVRASADELAKLSSVSGEGIEAAAILAEMFDRLPERYHEIVRLRAQGYSIADVAKHYGIPWTTAKSRWDRACEVMGAHRG